jgi:hypothetical protein
MRRWPLRAMGASPTPDRRSPALGKPRQRLDRPCGSGSLVRAPIAVPGHVGTSLAARSPLPVMGASPMRRRPPAGPRGLASGSICILAH